VHWAQAGGLWEKVVLNAARNRDGFCGLREKNVRSSIDLRLI